MLRKFTKIDAILIVIFLVFFITFIIKANISMITSPFYDFDEAHRAETAKRMKEYHSFFVPLTGSVYDRVETLKIPFREDPNIFLYYHIERPPLIYMLMIASTTIFGDSEWAYRFPSFLLGIGTIIGFVIFAKLLTKKIHIPALLIGLLVLITSEDLWLSSQYAQLDTGISTFLFLSLLSLITYCMQKKNRYIFTSGILFALAVLAKGQPAFIFVFPLLYLTIAKQLSIKDLIKFFVVTLLFLSPWIITLVAQFGLTPVITIFNGFALTTATQKDFDHTVPIFWYVRWWFVSFRLGWILFLVLIAYNSIKGKFNLQRKILLVYVLGGLLFFSLFKNKFWWYVLPLIPTVSFYVFLSVDGLLNSKKNMAKAACIIFFASVPILLHASNAVSILYGGLITGTSLLIMFSMRFEKTLVHLGTIRIAPYLLLLSFASSLIFFSQHFPRVAPHNLAEKPVAKFYASLLGKKCLWFKDMPSEAILFYSNAGGVRELTENVNIFPHCQNYLITPVNIRKDQATYRNNINQTRYLRDAKVIHKEGTLSFVLLDQ